MIGEALRDWDWDGMVEWNRRRLVELLAGLFVLLGTGPVVTRGVWRRILAALVPVESAIRRLIFVMARDLVVVLPPARDGKSKRRGKKGTGSGNAVFPLTDTLRDPDPKPRTCPRRKEPRIAFLDEWEPRDSAPCPADDDPLDATALRRRMAAAQAALADLAAQAMRLARWRARNERARESGAWRRLCSLRSGRAPGHREQGKREADRALGDCQDLALRCRRMLENERYGA